MNNKTSFVLQNRRQFLRNLFPAGTLLCLGCNDLLALPHSQEKPQADAEKHKFLHDSEMTIKDVFDFAFSGYIPLMQHLASEIGKDKLFEILKTASSEFAKQNMENIVQNLASRDLTTFASFLKSVVQQKPFSHVLTYEIVEETDKAFELKYSECLFAETFRKANAAELGYVTLCYSDFATVQAFNPKIKLIRTKTLMQGHDCCNHRWVWEG